MKKVTSICLIALLLLVYIQVSTAEASTKITATTSNQMGISAKEWFSSKQGRATLTVSVAIDMLTNTNILNSDDFVEFLLNPTWVGISSNQRQLLVVGYYGSTTLLTIIYTPKEGTIEYTEVKMSFTTTLPDSLIETMVNQIYKDQSATMDYYKNDAEEVLKVLSDIIE